MRQHRLPVAGLGGEERNAAAGLTGGVGPQWEAPHVPDHQCAEQDPAERSADRENLQGAVGYRTFFQNLQANIWAS